MEFLATQAEKYPDLSGHYDIIGGQYEKKLWHQLTESLSSIFRLPEFNRGHNMIDLYESFISKFEGKLNQLRFVQLCSVITRQYFPARPLVEQEVLDAAGFMEFVAEKRDRLGDEAYLVAQMAVAELLVQLGGEKHLKKAKGILDLSQPLLQSLADNGVETIVSSSFYRVSCEYHKVVGPADEYYKSCIQFLAYTPQETLAEEVQLRLAIDMSLAALVGETVFNYGEVLAQPVLGVLDGTEYSWLHELLHVFSAGDIGKFSSLCNENKDALNKQAVIVQNSEMLRQKIALLCLMQTVFVRPPEERTLQLKEVAQVTKLELDQVEWLLMKAMSKGLIKGKIDQVKQEVRISWLKPRVLDTAQLATLKDKVDLWQDGVGKTLGFIVQETPELFQ